MGDQKTQIESVVEAARSYRLAGDYGAYTNALLDACGTSGLLASADTIVVVADDRDALRADVARLTGELDEARRKLDQEWESANGWAAKASELDQRLAAAEAESERLREALVDIAKWGGQLNVTHDGKVCARKAAAALRGATS